MEAFILFLLLLGALLWGLRRVLAKRAQAEQHGFDQTATNYAAQQRMSRIAATRRVHLP